MLDCLRSYTCTNMSDGTYRVNYFIEQLPQSDLFIARQIGVECLLIGYQLFYDFDRAHASGCEWVANGRNLKTE